MLPAVQFEFPLFAARGVMRRIVRHPMEGFRCVVTGLSELTQERSGGFNRAYLRIFQLPFRLIII